MKATSIKAKFEKAGYSVTTWDCHGCEMFHVTSHDGKREAEFENADYVDSISVKRTNDQSDMYADYCAWSFYRTIKSAVSYIQRGDARRKAEAVAARKAEIERKSEETARRRKIQAEKFAADRDAKRIATDPNTGIKVRFNISESCRVPSVVCTVADAEALIEAATACRMSEGKDGGYYKTNFEILIEGESVYGGRFDIGRDVESMKIADHIGAYTDYIAQGHFGITEDEITKRRSIAERLRNAS